MVARSASHASRRSAPSPALRYARIVAAAVLTAVILVAGVRTSWGTAQHVVLGKGREQGTIRVTECAEHACSGPFSPTSVGAEARGRVEIEPPSAVDEGGVYAVTVKPGTDDVVRAGMSGLLYAWVPFGGSLLLASVVVAGGLHRTRLAWALGGSGLALITGAFVLL